MSSEDSLQDIPDTDLPLLKKLYEKYQNTAPHVFNLFQICIDWKLKKKSDGNLYFYGVDNDWLETGTFILVFEVSITIQSVNLKTTHRKFSGNHKTIMKNL